MEQGFPARRVDGNWLAITSTAHVRSPDVADQRPPPTGGGHQPNASALRRRLTALARHVAVDIGPLRSSRDFRLLIGGGAVSMFGSFITFVAIPFQVKELTGSYLAVGLLGAAELVLLVGFGLWGGALADAVDRRKMVLGCEAGMCLLTCVLLINSLLDEPQIWPLYLVVGLVAALDGLQRPSLEALIPRIVAHDQLAAAAAVSSFRWQAGSILGPVVGGILVVTAPLSVAYAIDAGTFLVCLIALSMMRAVPPAVDAARPSVRGILAGLRYAMSRTELVGTYVVDMAAMFFAMPIALFPFLADQLGTPWALGGLYAAGQVGALAATLTSGWTSHVHRHGKAIVYAALAWGAAIAAVGLTRNVWLVLFFLAVAGGADMISGLFRSTIWNQTIPDEFRGRLAGIELLSYSSGPLLGQARAGGVASFIGVRPSIVSGGLMCIAAVSGLAAGLPRFWRYDERTNVHAVRQRDLRAAAARAAVAIADG
jgi:MFS family permease